MCHTPRPAAPRGSPRQGEQPAPAASSPGTRPAPCGHRPTRPASFIPANAVAPREEHHRGDDHTAPGAMNPSAQRLHLRAQARGASQPSSTPAAVRAARTCTQSCGRRRGIPTGPGPDRMGVEARIDAPRIGPRTPSLYRPADRQGVDVALGVVEIVPRLRVDAAHGADHLRAEQDVLDVDHPEQQVDAGLVIDAGGRRKTFFITCSRSGGFFSMSPSPR